MTASSYLAELRDLPPGAADLARHAAVPVVVDAGFLNLLRVNFFVDPPAALPYEVEAELLLSPLFREVGEGLYEIDPEWRNTLLTELVAQYGTDRLGRVAGLLEQYTDHAVAWHALPELENAQRLTALSLLDPPRAKEWLEREMAEATSVGTPLPSVWFVAMEKRVREHQAVLESAGAAWSEHDRDRFLDELIAVFREPSTFGVLLDDLYSPAPWARPGAAGAIPRVFWIEVVSDLEQGRVPGRGLVDLAEAVYRLFPANSVFRTTLNTLRLLAGPLPSPPTWPTLIITGSELYDVFMPQLLDLIGPRAEQLYGAGPEAAVYMPDRERAQAIVDAAEALARRMVPGSEIRVRFQEFGFRPYLIPKFRLVGPDTQEFVAERTPATRTVRELAQAVIDLYVSEWSEDRRHRIPRTVVDLVTPADDDIPQQHTRLDPDQTLHEAGVTEGSRLQISADSVSGGGILSVSVPNRAQFVDELAAVFHQQEAARDLLADIRYPVEGGPIWPDEVSPRTFWTAVLGQLEFGLLGPDGARQLASAALRRYAGNRVFRTAAEAAGSREFEFEPYLIETLTVLGPDKRAFQLNDIPATTLVDDIPRMISERYAADVWEEYFGGYQVGVEHLVPPPVEGRFRFMHLDPAQTLHGAGVQRGDQLRLQSELTPADAVARYHRLGVLARDRGDNDEAERRFQQCLTLQEEMGDRAGAAATHQQLGFLAQAKGDYLAAESRHSRALNLMQESGDRAGAATSYYQLGIAVLNRGDVLRSERWFQQALAVFEELGDRANTANSYYQLGLLAQMRGVPVEAERRHQQALAIELELGNRAAAAVSYQQLGILARNQRNFAEAEHRQQQALSTFAELGVQNGIAGSYHQLALIAQDRGRYGEAERRYEQAVATFEQIGDRAGAAAAIIDLAGLRFVTDDLAQSVALHCQALAIRLDLGIPLAANDLTALRSLRQSLGEVAFTNLASRRLTTSSLWELKALLDPV